MYNKIYNTFVLAPFNIDIDQGTVELHNEITF